ncbi:hypothetical protein AAP_05750 [Ascosphaera apis ARSEF 7405]|uniref:Uncharacterized protein n=1 Tax=Ascosphaera apis ARSEF 7405 TaxID=392613 RepID=A0A167VDC8_9EURO|nr:hypothetical protein AAP_05750 [Ascosphaera apis ARSEF 7405]
MSPARAGSGSGPGPGPDPWRQASSSSRNGIISSVSGSYYQSHQQGQPQGQAGQAQTQRSFHPITVLNSSSSSSVANAPYNAPASAASAVISAVSAVRPVQPPQGQGQGHDQAYSTHYSRAHHSAAGVTTTTTSTASTLQTQPAASRSSLVTAATPSLHHQYQSQQLQQFPTAAAGVVPAYTPPPPSQGYGQGQAQPTYHHSTSAHIQHSAPPSSSLAYHSQYPHSTYPHQGQYPTAADRATNSISSMASTYDAASATTANGGAGSGGLLGPNSSMIPLTTIPVDTPSNKRGEFAHSLQQSRKNEEEKNPFYQPPEFDPLNFSTLPEKTPRIYDHCVKGLESGLPTEVEFALHHLVIISDERGDKFRFCDFPGLADSLLEAAWEITFLIHGVSFETSYDPISADDPRINVIDGCYGTPDLVRRINALPVTMQGNGEEELETVGLGRYRRMVSEAALVIHNMCTLEENAIWLADMAAFKDWVIYLLNMPAVAREKYVEILNNALETAEMVAPFWVFEKNDALIPGLLECLKSSDRTHIILALRIFVCWGMDRPDARKEMALDGYMTEEILKAVFNSLLLEQDRDMLNTTLDFLYQYTTVPSNVAHVIRLLDSELPTR